MTKFRKKPIVVEAVQWLGFGHGSHGFTISRDVGGRRDGLPSKSGQIETAGGWARINPGDWIIIDAEGKPYPCVPSVFEATYEDGELFAEVGAEEGVLEGKIHAALNRLNGLLLTATAEGRSPHLDHDYMLEARASVQLRGADWWSDGEEIVHGFRPD